MQTRLALLLLSIQLRTPAVISDPGTYVMTRDVTTRSGAALMITASNVTLDLNGFTLQGPGQQVGNGIVISGATSVRVTNGIIADFGFGVMVANSNNVTLRDLSIRAAGCPRRPELGQSHRQQQHHRGVKRCARHLLQPGAH